MVQWLYWEVPLRTWVPVLLPQGSLSWVLERKRQAALPQPCEPIPSPGFGTHAVLHLQHITILGLLYHFLWITWFTGSCQHVLRAQNWVHDFYCGLSMYFTAHVSLDGALRETSSHISIKRNPASPETLYFSFQFSCINCMFLDLGYNAHHTTN
jgi:hypothetical protein